MTFFLSLESFQQPKSSDMIFSHSISSILFQSNLSSFDRHLCNEILTMNGIESTFIRLPKREQTTQMSPQDCYGSENSQSNSICDMDSRPMFGLDSKFSISSIADENNINIEVARLNSTLTYSNDNNTNKKHEEDDRLNYCSDDSVLSVGKEVDEMINENKKAASHLTDPIDRTYNQTKLPCIIRPNPTRREVSTDLTHHIYAEEIMKHQLNFMTVTKGLNISNKSSDTTMRNEINSIHSAAVNPSLKLGLSCLQVYANDKDLSKKWSVIEDRSAPSPETTHFRQIHTHLNAITKITTALGRDSSQLCTKVQTTSPGNSVSREDSQSPPSSSSSIVNHHIFHNNFNENNLKFSIDNILKPSFGCRITDPLLKRNKSMRKSAVSHKLTYKNINTSHDDIKSTESIAHITSESCEKKKFSLPHDEFCQTSTNKESVDVNSSEQSDKPNSNGTGPLSWPAWVYCTRYSDRPSSGKIFTHILSFYFIFI